MPSFQKFFFETKGKPITYKGKTLVMVDDIPVKDGETLRLVCESVNSEWKQGVSIRIRDKGFFIINGEKVKAHLAVWHNPAHSVFEFTIKAKDKNLEVKNIWDTGNGVTELWHNGAAMIVEETPNGRRYLCNDGHPDENFDDIIFRIERVTAIDKK
ncbi:MAG: hypothetical protein WC455_06860 [Dehalococcoidia bacterium]|jgi:hypoxanthine phosphoribosyltransferase